MKECLFVKTKLNFFIKGAATVLDLYGSSLKNPYEGLSPKEADTKALRSDWEAIGGDMKTVFSDFELRKK